MKEGEKVEEVNINMEIPPHILKDVLDESRKRKADSSPDGPHKVHCMRCNAGDASLHSDIAGVSGDREDNLEKYWN